MSAKCDENVMKDIFLIAKAVKKHYTEPDCKHDIKTIVKEALEN